MEIERNPSLLDTDCTDSLVLYALQLGAVTSQVLQDNRGRELEQPVHDGLELLLALQGEALASAHERLSKPVKGLRAATA